MSNLDELAKAVRAPTPARRVVEYRSAPPPPSSRSPRRWSLPAPVTLARLIGWSLTAFAALQALLALLWLVVAIFALSSTNSLERTSGGLGVVMALGFMAGALTVGALGQIVLLLAELVVQGRSR
jgi:hypothetical protein